MRALFDRGLRLSAGRGATFEQKVESAMGRKRKEPTPAAAALAGEAQAVPPADAADEEVEEVVVGAVAVDPGGDGAADEEQPPNGYDSDKEEVPLEIEEDTVTHEDDADDASELTLEEAEAAIAADAVAAAPGTAASMELAMQAAVAELRAKESHATPPSKQEKAAETKAANEAKKEWVEKQWVEVKPGEPRPPTYDQAPPEYEPPEAPRRKKYVTDPRTKRPVETGDLEPADPVKDFEAAYKRKHTKGGPTLAVSAFTYTRTACKSEPTATLLGFTSLDASLFRSPALTPPNRLCS